jgi:hypothetical protein
LTEVKKKRNIKERRLTRKFQVLIFIVLFISAELVLRIAGFKPGVLKDQFYLDEVAQWDPIMVGDEMGISHYAQKGSYSDTNLHHINSEGFLSDIEFTARVMDSIRQLGKKIVFLIGDSYTSGCCADEYSNSFAGLLTNSKEYVALNFGIGGVDPLQYELIVKKYIPLLKPDLVAIISYLGNDEMLYDKTPKAGIPYCYVVDNGHWISSEYPTHYNKANTYAKNFEEAKKFYYEYYSLRSKQSNFFERLIRPSIILSRMYLFAKIMTRRISMKDDLTELVEKPPFSYNHFKGLKDFCDSTSTPVIFTGIPTASDILEKVNVTVKYEHFFNEIEWKTPLNLKTSDYDGMSIKSHFDNSGHAKFAKFLHPQIMKQLNKR